MVPARVERTPTAPDIFVTTTSKIKPVKFVTFKSGLINRASIVPPAIIKDRFCDNNHT